MPTFIRKRPMPVSPSPSGTESQQGRRVKIKSGTISQIELSQRSRDLSVRTREEEPGAGYADEEHEVEEGSEAIRLLSLQSTKQRIAASFYDGGSTVLSIMEDTEDSKSFDMAQNVMQQLAPTVIIANTRSSEDLLQAVHDYCEDHECTYQIRPHKDYWIGTALSRLSLLNIRQPIPAGFSEDNAVEMDRPAHGSAYTGAGREDDVMGSIDMRMDAEEHRKQMRLAKLGCFTDLGAELAVGTAGALIAQLQRHGDLIASGEDRESLTVSNIEHVKLQEYMYINADSLSALSVFDEEDHASMYSRKTKEGLSLFGIMDTCSTKMGAALLRRWFLRPLLSLEDIKARHDAVATFQLAENQELADVLRQKMKRIKNVQGLLGLIQAGPVPWMVWKNLADFVFTSLEMKDVTQQMISWEATVITQQISSVVTTNTIGNLGARIAEVFDWDSSRDQDEVVIRPGLDQIVDDANAQLANLEETLCAVADRVEADISRRDRDLVQSVNVVTFPQMGFLIAAIIQPGSERYPSGWDFRFTSEERLYFKDDKTRDLDEQLGDLQGVITDRSIELVEDLREEIVERQAILMAVADVCAEVDALLAFASFARRCNLVRPNMVSGNMIAIQGGRHLLHEENQPNYVPNDTLLTGVMDTDGSATSSSSDSASAPNNGEARIMMITGANGSGKSAYAKQVALIVFMAQTGSFVPAQAAMLGVVDKIFTRLHTRESISQQASSFMIDLSQVSLALRGATSRSLMILDELGKGTETHDGTSLLTGVLQHLLDRGSGCPHVIAITHFHELFARKLLKRSDCICFFEMKALQTPDAGGLVFLYRLVKSSAVTSFAFECAFQHGIPPEVVERARYVADRIVNYETASLEEDGDLDEKDIQDLAVAEELTRRFLSWDLQDISDPAEHLLTSLRGMLDAARQDVHAAKEAPEAEDETESQV